MGLFDDLFETETKVEYPWWVEQSAQVELDKSRLQLDNIRKASEFQAGRLEALPGELETEAGFRQAAAEGAAGLLDTTRQLVDAQAEAAAQGAAATPEQRALIQEQARQAIAAGESDINRFLATTGETLREELSPTLGLRPTDSPIVDRGQRAREEAIRQQGQLVRNVRGQQAQQLLEFPLAAQQVGTQTRTAGASMAEATRQFQQQLAQAAFQNRLALTGQVGTQGLQLTSAGGNVPILTEKTTERDVLGKTAQLLQGAGGLSQGLGLTFGSSPSTG